MNMSFNYNNRNGRRGPTSATGQLISSISTLIFMMFFAGIFISLFSSFQLVDDLTKGYFYNFILVFATAVGYIFYSNITKAVLIIVCFVQGKKYDEEIKFHIAYHTLDLIAGIIIILIMLISAFNMFMNNTHNAFINGWAIFIPYGIIAILGLSRISASIKNIKLIKKLNNPDNFSENNFSRSASNNIYNSGYTAPQNFNSTYNNTNIPPYTPPVNHNHPYRNTSTYNQSSYNTPPQQSTTKTNKFCTECGMRLEPGEKVCPVCQTKVK